MRLASDVLVDGGLLATFIDWRSVDLILSAGRELGLDLLNIVVWAKSNAGQGSLWRSRHEMLPVFATPTAPAATASIEPVGGADERSPCEKRG